MDDESEEVGMLALYDAGRMPVDAAMAYSMRHATLRPGILSGRADLEESDNADE